MFLPHDRSLIEDSSAAHMPLDAEIHWDARNPLNIVPAIIALVLLIAILSLVL